MIQPEILEGSMLIAFSVSWYWSIGKMLKVKQAAGKSLFFVVLICCGYSLGIGSKLVLWIQTSDLSPLLWLYVWNLGVTLFDLFLVVHYSRKEVILSAAG